MATACFFLGMMIYNSKKQEIFAIETLIFFLQDISSEISFLYTPLISIITKLSHETRYTKLDFLIVNENDKYLNRTLFEGFQKSEFIKLLETSEKAVVFELFKTLGNDVCEIEINKLEYAILKLKKALDLKKEFLKNKNGYYQTVCVLIGAVICLILI